MLPPPLLRYDSLQKVPESTYAHFAAVGEQGEYQPSPVALFGWASDMREWEIAASAQDEDGCEAELGSIRVWSDQDAPGTVMPADVIGAAVRWIKKSQFKLMGSPLIFHEQSAQVHNGDALHTLTGVVLVAQPLNAVVSIASEELDLTTYHLQPLRAVMDTDIMQLVAQTNHLEIT